MNGVTSTTSDISTAGPPFREMSDEEASSIVDNSHDDQDGCITRTTTALERLKDQQSRKRNNKQRRSFGGAASVLLDNPDTMINNSVVVSTLPSRFRNDDISNHSESIWTDDIDQQDNDAEIHRGDGVENDDDEDAPTDNAVSAFLSSEQQTSEVSGNDHNDDDDEEIMYDHNSSDKTSVLPSDLLTLSPSKDALSTSEICGTPQPPNRFVESETTPTVATPISPEEKSNLSSTNDNTSSPFNKEDKNEVAHVPTYAIENHHIDTNDEPSLDDILYSTEILFGQVQDKTTVTVKDIIQSLLAEYQMSQFTKVMKAAIRGKLIELMTTTTKSTTQMETTKTTEKTKVKARKAAAPKNADTIMDEDEDDEGRVKASAAANVDSGIGDSDPSDNENDDDDGSDTQQGDNDDDEALPSEDDDDEEYTARTSKKKTKKIVKQSSKETKSSTKIRKPQKGKERTSRTKKPSAASTKLALRVHAEQLRKRRLEELRIRNEELLVHQNSIDKERAECIAAKFVTNTAELRQIRFEQRNQLLSKLNMKRINACSSVPTGTTIASIGDSTTSTIQPDEKLIKNSDDIKDPESGCPMTNEDMDADAKNKNEYNDDSDDDDDDDDELEIVGHPSLINHSKTHPGPSTKESVHIATKKVPPFSKPNNAMALLDLADANMLRKKTSISSPSRGMIDPRALLRHQLKEKQRLLGNRWLARELGYQTEAEHLEACIQEENNKRERIYQQEQQRIKDTERAIERMLQEDDDDGGDEQNSYSNDDDRAANNNEDDESESVSHDGNDNTDDLEEDEEMAMARDMKIEKPTIEDDSRCPVNNEMTESNASDIPDENIAILEKEESNDASEGILSNAKSSDFPDSQLDEDPVRVPLQDLCSSDDNIENDLNLVNNEKEIEATTTAPTELSMNREASEVTNESESDTIDEPKEAPSKQKGPRNSAWQAILQRDAEKAKKKKRSQLIEEEADEEEEEEVAGLEDFGFVVQKKKTGDDDENEADLGEYDEDDLKHIVDDLSDDEGDEAAGERARKAMEAKEEKERHKEMIRRMREGYDGRRGGIAGGGGGARGIHRFDQLVAADNREDAKQLGLLNDDELDSDNEDGEDKGADNEEDDEHVLLDKMLKARFLHRSTVEEEQFSDDDEGDENVEGENDNGTNVNVDEDELEQERLAKRFAKRARMQRLIETHGHEAEFSQSKLIDEDTTLRIELQRMKNGLIRSQSDSISNGWQPNNKSNLSQGITSSKPKVGIGSSGTTFASSLLSKGGSLAIALQANRKKERTTFVSSSGKTGTETSSSISSSYQKCIAFNHVVFHHASNSNSGMGKSRVNRGNTSKMSNGSLMIGQKSYSQTSNIMQPPSKQDSLFSKVAATSGSNPKKRKV